MTLSLSKKVFRFVRLSGDISNYPMKEHLSEFQRASLQWLGDIIRPSRSRAFWDGSMYMWWLPEGVGNKGVYLSEYDEALYIDESTNEIFTITDFMLDMPRTDGGKLTYKTT